MESKLEAFEVWAYRRMLRVSWTEHKTNEEVLKMANTISSLSPRNHKEKKMPVFWTRNKSEVAQLCLENSTQTLLNFLGRPPKKLERFVWSFLRITG